MNVFITLLLLSSLSLTQEAVQADRPMNMDDLLLSPYTPTPKDTDFELPLVELKFTDRFSGRVTHLDEIPEDARLCRKGLFDNKQNQHVMIVAGPHFSPLYKDQPAFQKPIKTPSFIAYRFLLTTNTSAAPKVTAVNITQSFKDGTFTRTVTAKHDSGERQERTVVELNPDHKFEDFVPRRDLKSIRGIHHEVRRGALDSPFDSKPEVLKKVICQQAPPATS